MRGRHTRLGVLLASVAAAVTVGAAPAASADPTLTLGVDGERFYPNDLVVVTVRMTDLGATPAAGFQAFVEYDESELTFVVGSYTAAPFGQAIITPIAAAGGQIDLAAGVNVSDGQSPSASDADVATLAFRAEGVGCIDSVQFRPHDPPTRITDAAGDEILPLTLAGLPPAPVPCGCPCEYDGNGHVDVFDLLTYLTYWFDDDENAEIDGDPGIDVFDLLAYLQCWFPASAGGACP